MKQINGKDKTSTRDLALAIKTIGASSENTGKTIDKLIELIEKEKKRIEV